MTPDKTVFPSYLDQVCHQIFDEDSTLQVIYNVYDLDNIWTSDKSYLRVLPPIPLCYSNVTSVGFQSVYSLSDTKCYTQERPFLVLRDKKTTATKKPHSLSVMLLEKDLGQKGKM